MSSDPDERARSVTAPATATPGGPGRDLTRRRHVDLLRLAGYTCRPRAHRPRPAA